MSHAVSPGAMTPDANKFGPVCAKLVKRHTDMKLYPEHCLAFFPSSQKNPYIKFLHVELEPVQLLAYAISLCHWSWLHAIRTNVFSLLHVMMGVLLC